MESTQKKANAQAARRIVANSATQITDVIESDKDIHLWDRVAASAAAFILCGPSYFLVWFLLSFMWNTADGSGLLSLIFYTWRLPLLATVITSLAAFVAPSWTTWTFGALMRWAEILINWQPYAFRPKSLNANPKSNSRQATTTEKYH
jgi:hypothetical protein